MSRFGPASRERRRLGAWAVSGSVLLIAMLAGCGSSQSGAATDVPAASASVSGSAPGRAGNPPGAAADEVPVPNPGAAVTVPADDRPVRITIPSIDVDASLIDLGIAKDGSLQVPTRWQQAGWLDRSPAPGQQGPAVIAGHVDSKRGPAVFYRLTDLKAGAQIVITTAGGRKIRFSVDRMQRYPKSGFPTAAVYGPVPGPVLRLITCGGVFDRRSDHYRDNIVVYAS